jgi:hypothetical protein
MHNFHRSKSISFNRRETTEDSLPPPTYPAEERTNSGQSPDISKRNIVFKELIIVYYFRKQASQCAVSLLDTRTFYFKICISRENTQGHGAQKDIQP